MTEAQAPLWAGQFAEIHPQVNSLVVALVEAEWVVEDVQFGAFTSPTTVLGMTGVTQAVELITHDGDSNWRVALVGVLAPWLAEEGLLKERFLIWQVRPVSRVGEQRSVVDHGSPIVGKKNDPQDVVQEIAHLIRGRREVAFDLHRFLGDPTAAISVFAILSAFLGGLLGKVAEDVYVGLKRVVRAAPRTTRFEEGVASEWVVIHDVEFNTVLECPSAIPPEAAVQLATLAREQLTRAHLRWNCQTQVWDRVGRNPDAQPQLPPPDPDET
ncbi:hypothetical protein [Streptomyces sp. NPDC059262]|uniref:hypothetical protein n=1 Tax=Streptomyces sp. NPDC059262 TaxID=3346797 RepID=UPI00369779A0